MAKTKKRRKIENRTNLLEMPEEIFRQIFEYLGPDIVYLIIRKVCKRLKYYVDGFMKPEEIFAPASGRQMPKEIHYDFKRNNSIITVCSELANPELYLKQKNRHWETDVGSFGAIYNDKIVIGIHPSFQGFPNIQEHSRKKVMNSITFTLFKFDPLENDWKRIPPDDSFSIQGPVDFWTPIGNSGIVLFCRNDLSSNKIFCPILFRININDIEDVKNEYSYRLNGKKVLIFTESGTFREIPKEPNRVVIRLK